MREGSSMSHRKLLELNDKYGRIIFDENDIDFICELIRIHDNPSLNIKILKSNFTLVAFREADRLWMLSPDGINADLIRKGKNKIEKADIDKQVRHNYNRFKEERNLYSPNDGPFIDSETFFRTKRGWEICQEYLKILDAIRV